MTQPDEAFDAMLGAVLAPPERPGDRAFLVRVEHRIDAEGRVDHIGRVGAQDDKRRMGDVDHVQPAESDGQAQTDGGIESAQQNPGDDGVRQQIESEHRRTARDGGGYSA